MRSELAAALVVVLALAAGCVPELDVDESIVTSPRVVAVRAVPPEVRPGETVSLEALVLDAAGPVDAPALDWSFCLARFGADATDDALPARCAAGDGLSPIGRGATVEATVPLDACRLFGPDLPPPVPGEPPGRPTSADSTGGYALPVVVDTPGARVVYGVRLRCGLAGATQEQAATFERRYTRNAAPGVVLETLNDAGAEPIGEEGLTVPPGGRVELRARWPACPTLDACGDAVCGPDEDATGCADDCDVPAGCTGAERYLRFDPVERALEVDAETIRVAWFASAGLFDVERNGALSETPFVDNAWTAASPFGDAWLAAVVRDSRGGVAWTVVPARAEE